MDTVSPVRRSKMMSGIKGKDTKPELAVRRMAHDLGFRIWHHRKDLPGSPDLAFPLLKLAVYVHGCFWHRHEDCRYAHSPKTNVEFWTCKFKNNAQRDMMAKEGLETMGWRVATIWECATVDAVELCKNLYAILTP